MADLEHRIDMRLEDFCNLINKKYLSTDKEIKPMDLAITIAYLTMDVITDLAFGAPFGYIKEDKELFNYFRELELGLNIGLGVAFFPWLGRLLKHPLVVAAAGGNPPGISQLMKNVSRAPGID